MAKRNSRDSTSDQARDVVSTSSKSSLQPPSQSKSPPDLPLNLPDPYPHTFTQIIDADHMTVQQIAAKIRRLLTPILPTRNSSQSTQQAPSQHTFAILHSLTPLLLEATWRLIRHDFSEDIVMRPCFTAILGPEGTQMSNHDREDHAAGRTQLLDITQNLVELQATFSGSPTPTSPGQMTSQPSNQEENPHRPTTTQVAKLHALATAILTTFDNLSKHMEIESGSFLPHFESLIDKATSARLARDYAATLFITPHLLAVSPLPSPPSSSPSSPSSMPSATEQARVFPGGVPGFVNTDLASMRRIYETAVDAASRSEVVATYLLAEIQKEVDRLQVGKWDPRRMIRERKGSLSASEGEIGQGGEKEGVGKGKL